MSPPPSSSEAHFLAAATKAREAAQAAREASWACWLAFLSFNGATEMPIPGDTTPSTMVRIGQDAPLVPLAVVEEIARAALLSEGAARRLDLNLRIGGKIAATHGDAAVKAGQATIAMAQAMEHEACECPQCTSARRAAADVLGPSLARAREAAQACPQPPPEAPPAPRGAA